MSWKDNGGPGNVPAPGTRERLEYVRNDAVSLISRGENILLLSRGGGTGLKKHLEACAPNVRFRRIGEGGELPPLSGETYDTAILYDLPLPEKHGDAAGIVAEISASLKPGGRVIFCAGVDPEGGETALERAELFLREEFGPGARDLCFHKLNEYGYVLCSFSPAAVPEGKGAYEEELPEIGIIMPTYNRPELLKRAIGSVLAQRHRKWKLLVVNDGGSDVSGLVKSFNDPRISYYFREHGGKAAVMNFALKQIDTPWIGYLDDDDTLGPDHFDCLLKAALRDGNEAAYNDIAQEWVDAGTGAVFRRLRNPVVDCDARKLRFQNFISHIHLIHSKRVAEEIGEYDTTLPIYVDYDYIRRISRRFDFTHVNLITGVQSFRCTNGVPDSMTGLKMRDPGAAGQAIMRILGKTPEDLMTIYNGFLERSEEVNELFRQLESNRGQLDDSQRKLLDLRREADGMFRELEAKCAALDSKCADFDSKCADFDRKCADLASKDRELEKMRSSSEELKADYDLKCADLASKDRELEKMRSFSEKLKADFDSKCADLESKNLELEKMRSIFGELKAEYDWKCADLASQNMELEKLRSIFGELKADFGRKCSELTSRSLELEKMRSASEKLRSALDTLRKEKNFLRDLVFMAERRNRDLFEQLYLAVENIRDYQRSRTYRYTRFAAKWKRSFFEWRQAQKKRIVSPLIRLAGKIVVFPEKLRTVFRMQPEKKSAAFVPVQSGGEFLTRKQLADSVSFRGDAGLRLPPDMPLTSVIIPVYNNLAWTRRCLNSIYTSGIRSPFEVIVMDDCSGEDIASLGERFPEVRIIRNPKNLGFLRTANAGAAAARGEYIIFLNNDTEVLPRWLDELANALYRHPEAGMIGSALIHFSTGKLQESGNLICKNGMMMPLGRGIDPKHPEFTAFREVDFCSAASIILRKSDFDAVGGFSEIYAPAYFEDPDLALKLQVSGKKNYVMPLSQVLHQEMASYGDTLDEKCERNRRIFYERWGEYLKNHSLYATPEEIWRVRHYKQKRVLYIDAQTPQPDRGSGCMDAVFFMEYFIKRGYDVVFHGEYTPGFDPKYTAMLLRMGVECVYEPHRSIWQYLEENGGAFSLVFVSRVYQAQCFDGLIRKYCPDAAYIFNTVDLHFIRERLEAELSGSDKRMLRAVRTEGLEMTFAGNADGTIVISTEERDLLVNRYKLERIYHIPQARRVRGCRNPFAERDGMAFIGSAHPPNMDALLYFHDEILPRLNELRPGLTLTVVGEALAREMRTRPEYRAVADCEQIKFVGFVEDLSDVLDHVKLTVAPLRYGAGTKGKIASSMSCGVPCVSSRFGVEGTGMVPGREVMLADDPDDFAAAIVRLLDDEALWNDISAGGMEFLKRNYAPEAVERLMDGLLADVFERREMLTAAFPLLDDAAAAGAALSASGAPDAALWEAAMAWAPRRNGKLFCALSDEACRRAAAERCENTVFELSAAAESDFMVIPASWSLKELRRAAEMLIEGGRMVFSFAPGAFAGARAAEAFFKGLRGMGFADIRRHGSNVFCAGRIVEKEPEGVENW